MSVQLFFDSSHLVAQVWDASRPELAASSSRLAPCCESLHRHCLNVLMLFHPQGHDGGLNSSSVGFVAESIITPGQFVLVSTRERRQPLGGVAR